MKLRPSRRRRRGRIEIIPMIDVMFFLLATFMLASLTMQRLHALGIDLPRGQATPLALKTPVTLAVSREGELRLDDVPVTLDGLAAALRSLQASPEAPLVVAADAGAPNGVVVQAMLRARDAGARHFVFAVRPQ